MVSEVAWQSDDLDEEVVDLADRGDELVQVHRLGDIGVRVELVAAQDVLLGRGGGEDYDGDVGQVRVGLDLLQDLTAVVLGEVEVEEDQVGPRRAEG